MAKLAHKHIMASFWFHIFSVYPFGMSTPIAPQPNRFRPIPLFRSAFLVSLSVR